MDEDRLVAAAAQHPVLLFECGDLDDGTLLVLGGRIFGIRAVLMGEVEDKGPVSADEDGGVVVLGAAGKEGCRLGLPVLAGVGMEDGEAIAGVGDPPVASAPAEDLGAFAARARDSDAAPCPLAENVAVCGVQGEYRRRFAGIGVPGAVLRLLRPVAAVCSLRRLLGVPAEALAKAGGGGGS